MQATITKVFPVPREFTGKWGKKAAVRCQMTAAGKMIEAEYVTKPDSAAEHIEALNGLLNTEADFELEFRKVYDETEQYNLKNYPGRKGGDAGSGGGGGGRSYTPAWNQGEEGTKYHEEQINARHAADQILKLNEQRASNRRTAVLSLERLVGPLGISTEDKVLELCEKLAAFMDGALPPAYRDSSKPAQAPAQVDQPAVASAQSVEVPSRHVEVPAGSNGSGLKRGDRWTGGEGTKCPKCYAPNNALHVKPCV